MTPLRQWIAIVEPSASWLPLSAEQRRRVLETSGLTGLDIRLRPGVEVVARDCVAAGLPYRVHSWVGRYDGTRATVDVPEAGRQAQGVADRIGRLMLDVGVGPQSYGMNAERDWWSHNPFAVDALGTFAVRFHAESQVRLDYLGFAVPSWHYGRTDWDHDGDVDTVIPQGTQDMFARLQCMAYQDTAAQIGKVLARARAAWPKRPMGAFVSIGALRPDGTIIGRPDGILEVARRRLSGVEELTHYLGLPESWRRMLLEGNARVRPLVERIPGIAAACAARSET